MPHAFKPKPENHFRHATLATIALAATAGCGGGGTGSAGADGAVTIDLWSHAGGNDEELAVIREIIDDFNAGQDEFEVAMQSFPQGAYNDSVVAAASAGNMPCIVAIDAPNVANWAWAGHIQPLGLPESLFEGQLPGTISRVDGEPYAFGFYDAAVAMFARESTLNDAGVRIPTIDSPWTRDEFMAALAAIDGLGRYDFPLDIGTSAIGEWYPYALATFLQSFGGDLIDRSDFQSADGVLNGPEAVEWATWLRGMVEDGYIAQTSGADGGLDFANGQTGILFTGIWAVGTATEAFDDLLILPPPDLGNGPVIGSGSWQWAMSAQCEHPDGVRAFLTAAHTTENFTKFYDAVGLIPATADAVAEVPSFQPGGRNEIFFELADRFALERPLTPAYPFIASVFTQATRDILAGGNPQQILDRAVTEIDRDIAQNDGYR